MCRASKERYDKASISAIEMRSTCELILSSDLFINAPRMSCLLHFLVEKAISGDSRDTCEYAIGIGVFNRSAATYSTAEDPIVRVQVGRLREKLKTYYATSGAASDIEISIPLGSYLPVFRKFYGAALDDRREHALTIQPITCITQCENCESFTRGLHEELTYQLFRTFGKTIVIHLLPAVAVSGVSFSSKINSRHEVNHLLEGTVRIDSERIRVSIRLIDASLGCVAWSEQFDRNIFFAITQQEELAASICGALRHFLHV